MFQVIIAALASSSRDEDNAVYQFAQFNSHHPAPYKLVPNGKGYIQILDANGKYMGMFTQRDAERRVDAMYAKHGRDAADH